MIVKKRQGGDADTEKPDVRQTSARIKQTLICVNQHELRKGMVIIMANMGTRIAELRRAEKMTQEELAGILGVSSQTVSKWENSTTMPDILLLPLIADTFGVTIDTLFGNAGTKSSRGLSFAEVPDAVFDGVIESMQRAFTQMEADGCTEAALCENIRKVKKALSEGMASLVYTDSGDTVYLTEKLAVAVKRHDGGAAELLADAAAGDVLRVFASDSVRALLRLFMARENVKFTLSSLCRKLALPEEEVRTALGQLEPYGFVRSSELDSDGETIVIYESASGEKNGILHGMLACAAEMKQNRGYWGYRG